MLLLNKLIYSIDSSSKKKNRSRFSLLDVGDTNSHNKKNFSINNYIYILKRCTKSLICPFPERREEGRTKLSSSPTLHQQFIFRKGYNAKEVWNQKFISANWTFSYCFFLRTRKTCARTTDTKNTRRP